MAAMQKFLLKISLFLVLLFAADKGAYFLMVRFEDQLQDPRLLQIIQGEMERDLLVFGSSKGAKGISARQIADSTQLTTHNLSYNGGDLSWQVFLLKTVLKFNAAPQTILLTMDDPIEFYDHENYHFPSYNLYPLAHYNHYNNALISIEEHSPISRYFLTARLKAGHFNSELDPVAAIDSVRPDGSQLTQLYSPQKLWYGYFKYEPECDLEYKEGLLAEFEQICRDHHIQLILIYPPNFRNYNFAFWERIHELTGPQVLHHHYNVDDPKYGEPDFYYDADHLRRPGAEYFTAEVIEFLREKGMGK